MADATSRELSELLAAARARLEPQRLYPRPLRPDVRVVVWPWFFRLPALRRYVGYAILRTVVLSASVDELIAARGREGVEDLLVHELCHVWQAQHRPLGMLWAQLRHPYADNPFEEEARAAARAR